VSLHCPMFRCSLGRVCPRRRISPSCTGTPRTYRTSPSLFFGTSSSSRDQNSPSSKTAHALLNTSSESTKPHQSFTKLHDARLRTHFLAPSARGISPGTGVKGNPIILTKYITSLSHLIFRRSSCTPCACWLHPTSR
jgi:hypothetical protein